MFDENQLVEIKCHPKTKEHYISKGYQYTKKGDKFVVKAKDLSIGSNVRIEVICDFCKKPYYPKMVNYTNRTNKSIDACSDCRTLKGSNFTLKTRAKEHFEKLRKICEQNDYVLLTDESEYKDGYTPIVYECKKHGIKHSDVYMMLSGRGCRDCWYEELSRTQTLSAEYVKEEVEKYNKNILMNANEYIGSRVRNLSILCGCGRTFITSFNEYMCGNTKRCSVCSGFESNGEFAIRMVLEKYHIDFTPQKTFKDCIDKNVLPFDFYLADYKMVIEYDGRQHYESVDYFGGDKGLEYTQRHDDIKNEYCNKNNIKILRIPYWEENNIEQIIIKELNL